MAAAAALDTRRVELSKALRSAEARLDLVTGRLSSFSVSVALPLLLRVAHEATLLSSPGALHHLSSDSKSNSGNDEHNENQPEKSPRD